MAKVVENNSYPAWTTMNVRTVISVLLIGMVVGLVNYALYLFFDQLVFQPLLCRGDGGLVSCTNGAELANLLSILIASTVGLVFLVRERIFRPLLVVLAVAVALGGLMTVAVTLPWFLTAMLVVLLYSLAYALFAWLAQPTNLVASVTAVIVVVSLARLMLAI